MNPQKSSPRFKEIIGDTNMYEKMLLSAISPVDQIIVATAGEENATILTKTK